MTNQKGMKKVAHSVRTIKIQVVASCDAHYDQLGACGNFAFLGQIQQADEIWEHITARGHYQFEYV